MENERKKKFCTKCGKPLPEDSNLCSFCDIKEEDANTDDTIYEDINEDAEMISEETPEENSEEADDGLDSDNIQEDEYTVDDTKESTPKVYCRKCGSLVDSENGICTNCGADSDTSNSAATAICWILGILLLVFITAYATDNVETEEQRILREDLQLQISTLEVEKEQIQSELDECKIQLNDCQSQLDDSNRKLDFYTEYASIVPDNGSKQYHVYGCEKLGSYSFWIYNLDAAKQKGYYACPDCH